MLIVNFQGSLLIFPKKQGNQTIPSLSGPALHLVCKFYAARYATSLLGMQWVWQAKAMIMQYHWSYMWVSCNVKLL